MSPTSYQAAPPRGKISVVKIGCREGSVKFGAEIKHLEYRDDLGRITK